MADFNRSKKRLVIGVVFLVLLVGASFAVYLLFIKPPATCGDGKQNQDETGIDCGGVCGTVCQEKIVAKNLEVMETSLVPAGRSGQFDAVAKIRNPNPDAGASVFQYVFDIKDGAGSTLESRSGTGFILPGEEKYLLSLNIEADAARSARLTISDVKWERFANYRGKPALTIYNKRYNELSSAAAFSEAYGLVSNESPYDFRTLAITVILRDASGKPLAVNRTEMRTVRSKEERDFRLLWPSSFPGVVEQVEMEAEADVYNSENFIREYLPGGRFQEFTPSETFF